MNTLSKILMFLIVSNVYVVAQGNNTEGGQEITVIVTNLGSNDGKLFIALYNSEDSFLNSDYKSVITEITNKSCTVVFKSVPKGIYAISLFHDENGNNKMDSNFLGIPKEDYGCSNNAKGFMGPPKWSDAKFEITDKNIQQTIKL